MGYPDFTSGESANASDLDKMVRDGAALLTTGAAYSDREVVFIDEEDGKVYKADVDNEEDRKRYIGFAEEAATGADQTKAVRVSGVIDGLSLGDATTSVGETTGASQATTSDILGTLYSGQAPHRVYFYTTERQGNISKIGVYIDTKTGSGSDVRVRVYEVGTDGVETGAAIFDKSLTAASITASAVNNFVPASKPAVKPRSQYILVIEGTTGNASNNFQTRGVSGTVPGALKGQTDTGTEWSPNSQLISFTAYYDIQRNYYAGDYVYLDTTAGAITAREPQDNAVPVGIILSSSKVLVTQQAFRSQLIAKYFISLGALAAPSFYFMAPRDWRVGIVRWDDGNKISTLTIYRNGMTKAETKSEATSVQWTHTATYNTSTFQLECVQTLSTGTAAAKVTVHWYR